MEQFTADELHRIVVAFMRDSDKTHLGHTEEGTILFCAYCHMPVSGGKPHSPQCEGQARLVLAAKARRLQIAAEDRA